MGVAGRGRRYDLTCPNKKAAVTEDPSRSPGSPPSPMSEERALTEEHLLVNSKKHGLTMLWGWLQEPYFVRYEYGHSTCLRCLVCLVIETDKRFSSAQSAFSSPGRSKFRKTCHWATWSGSQRVGASNQHRPEYSPWDSERLCDYGRKKLRKDSIQCLNYIWRPMLTILHGHSFFITCLIKPLEREPRWSFYLSPVFWHLSKTKEPGQHGPAAAGSRDWSWHCAYSDHIVLDSDVLCLWKSAPAMANGFLI